MNTVNFMKTTAVIMSAVFLFFGDAYAGHVSDDVLIDERVFPQFDTHISSADRNGNTYLLSRQTNIFTFFSQQLRFQKSINGGLTWSVPRLVSGGIPAPGTERAFNYDMTHDDQGTIYIAYYDLQLGVRISRTHGDSWSSRLFFKDGFHGNSFPFPDDLQLCSNQSGDVFMLWRDYDGAIKVNYSNDFGETWFSQAQNFSGFNELDLSRDPITVVARDFVVNPNISCV